MGLYAHPAFFYGEFRSGHTNPQREYDKNGRGRRTDRLETGKVTMGGNDIGKSADQGTAQNNSDVLASCNVTQDDIDNLSSAFAPRLWLEVLPSRAGTILAALLAEIMTEGLTPDQEDILGNFVSAVGALISYKAARDDRMP
jgi:hypothetical protein